jgi:hypothetical protein
MVGIKLQSSRKPSRRADLKRVTLTTSTAIAYGKSAKRRTKTGKTADKFRGHDTDSRKFVAPDYARAASAGPPLNKEGGIAVYRSSAAFHRSAGSQVGQVTGGMQEGMTVIPGQKMSRVVYRGRSLGSDPFHTTSKKEGARSRKIARFKKSGKVRAVKVSNALKAASTLRAGVNPLRIGEAERHGATKGVEAILGAVVHQTIAGGTIVIKRPSSGGKVAQDVYRAWTTAARRL